MNEDELRIKIMEVDLILKTKQAAWETPRNIAIIIGAFVAITAAFSGVIGYKIGSTPPATINVHFDNPPIVVQPK